MYILIAELCCASVFKHKQMINVTANLVVTSNQGACNNDYYNKVCRNSCCDEAGLNSCYNNSGRNRCYDEAGGYGILLRILRSASKQAQSTDDQIVKKLMVLMIRL